MNAGTFGGRFWERRIHQVPGFAILLEAGLFRSGPEADGGLACDDAGGKNVPEVLGENVGDQKSISLAL